MEKKFRVEARDVVNLIQTDYAGYQPKKQAALCEDYLSAVMQEDSYEKFLEVTEHFIRRFQDHHLCFIRDEKQKKSLNFRVRRYQDHLYVTKVHKTSPLRLGDKICAIDKQDFLGWVQAFEKELDPIHERQDFTFYLEKAKQVQLSNGQTILIEDCLGMPPERTTFSFKLLEKGLGYLRLPNFMEGKHIRELLEKEQSHLGDIQFLIIDVRHNAGGSDSNYYPLLPYLITPSSKEQVKIDEANTLGMYYYVTERNQQLRQEIFRKLAQQNEFGEQAKKYIQLESDFFEHNAYVGEVLFTLPDEEFESMPKETKGHIQKCIVLSDYFCASSGDQFVATVKLLNKVTVLGRPTMGITDYSNCVEQPYTDFRLMYPISKMEAVNKGVGINGKGIQPNEYVAWTPAEITKDLLLERAIELCQ